MELNFFKVLFTVFVWGSIEHLISQLLKKKKRNECVCMAMLGWLKHYRVHQKATGLIPGQGTYLGYRFDPQSGHITGGN